MVVASKSTDGEADEDKGAPKPLPGGGCELVPVEQQSLKAGIIESRITQGGVCAHILVQHGHQDHGVGGVQEVEHHDE